MCNVIMSLRGMMGICMDGTGWGPFFGRYQVGIGWEIVHGSIKLRVDNIALRRESLSFFCFT